MKVLKEEINKLQKSLLKIAGMVGKNFNQSIKAFLSKDKDIAKQVISFDDIIDKSEVHFEEDCLKVIALHQPVAVDLRLLIAYLKINHDLERIGDLSVNIARKARFISQNSSSIETNLDYLKMTKLCLNMFKKSLLALTNENTSLAKQVLLTDKKVNKMKKEFHSAIIKQMSKSPKDVPVLIRYHGFVRNLERIADMATNISEYVIYILKGTIIRHDKSYNKESD